MLLDPVVFASNADLPKAVLLLAVVLDNKAPLPTATLLLPEVFSLKASPPKAVLGVPVVFADKLREPTAVLKLPEVLEVNACLPIAVLSPPVTAASKALSPRTVLPATEFAPLPIFTLLIVPSTAKAGPPARVKRFINAFPDVLLSCIILVEVLAKN